MPPTTPKISVIVPAYDVERYIEAALDSLLTQSQPFHEIIVINDGSRDKTGDLLAQYAHCQSVSVVTTVNRGLGRTRNDGIDRATGDFLYFFDADDLLSPNFVEAMTAEIAGHPGVDLIFFSGQVFYDQDFDAKHYQQVDDNEFQRGMNCIFACGLDAVGAMRQTGRFTPSACLYVSRRALWGSTLRFLPILHEDNDVVMRLSRVAKLTSVVNVSLFMRRLRNGSTVTSAPSRKNVDGYLAAFHSTMDVYRTLEAAPHRITVRRQLHDLVWLYLHTCSRAGLSPQWRALALFLRHGHVRPITEFWRLFLPRRVHARLKSAKGWLRTMRVSRK